MKNIFSKLVLVACLCTLLVGTAYAEDCKVCKRSRSSQAAVKAQAARCKRAQSTAELNVNNVRALINGYGNMWYDGSVAQYHLPKNSNTCPLFCAALWIGGTDVNDQLRIAALRFGSEGDDYWPGPLELTTAAVDLPVCNQYDKHYIITKTEVLDFMSMFDYEGVSRDVVDGIVVSSVVPTINYTIEHMLLNYIGKAPLFVAPGVKTGINIRYENPRELGSDRIANAVAAYEEYGGPCIFIDFGTATTFGVVDQDGSFLGGTICPGIKLSSEALVTGTAKLPRFELNRPETSSDGPPSPTCKAACTTVMSAWCATSCARSGRNWVKMPMWWPPAVWR